MIFKLEIELDVSIIGDQEEIDWYKEDVFNIENGVILHSNEIGDTIGEIKSIKILKEINK